MASRKWSPIGTVRIRKRRRRDDTRAFVKVAQPGVWRLRAHVVWERKHGPIPRGFVVHHRDHNPLNDRLRNLELMTKAAHVAHHRPDFHEKRIAAFTRARRRLRWSTRSETKRTGAPPKWTEKQLARAVRAMKRGINPNAAAAKYGVARTTLYRRARGAR